MKLIIVRLVLALAAFAIVPNALAAGSDDGDIFLDAKVGKTFGSNSGGSGYNSDSQSSWGVDGGYRWKLDDARLLGFDVGYMHFGDISAGDPMSFSTGMVSRSAISVGANYHFLFGDDKASYLQARVGVMSVKFDESFSTFAPAPVTTGSYSSHHGGWYYGLGIGRYVTQDFSLILVWELYNSGSGQSYSNFPTDLNLGFLGLEAEYRF